MLVCGFCVPLAMHAIVAAEESTTGPVAFTVHAALCTTDQVNDPELGLYDACHANGAEGVTFTFAGLDIEPVIFATDASGVGTGAILADLSSVSQVTLSADDTARGYTYCSDQNSGAVLFDGTRPEGGSVPLFTVDASQAIVCDWYIYIDGPAGDEAPVG